MVSRSDMSAVSWRNRVKELRYVSPHDLADHPLQHKVHPEQQQSVMRGILTDIGIADVLLAYESPTTGRLTAVDGHLRKNLADTPWPTVILDIDDAEAAYILAVGDEVTALALKDQDALAHLLHEVQSGASAVQQMLSALAEHEGLIPRLPDAQSGVNDPAAEWQSMPAFQQDDQLAWKQLIVNFETPDDLQAFATVVAQTITARTRSIWYPYKAPVTLQQYRYIDESEIPRLHH